MYFRAILRPRPRGTNVGGEYQDICVCQPILSPESVCVDELRRVASKSAKVNKRERGVRRQLGTVKLSYLIKVNCTNCLGRRTQLKRALSGLGECQALVVVLGAPTWRQIQFPRTTAHHVHG